MLDFVAVAPAALVSVTARKIGTVPMLSVLVSLQTMMFSVKDRLTREEKGATAVEYGLLKETGK